jgi:hypothetical protein
MERGYAKNKARQMRSDETPQRDLVRSGNFFGRVSAYVGLGWGELVGSYLSEDWKKLVRAQRRKMELIGMDHGLVGGTGEEMELVM